MSSKVALSACLTGCNCRYDGAENLNESLLERLSGYEMVTFCPEDDAFGTPRPTMDLVEEGETLNAISNETGSNLSAPIVTYAQDFFKNNPDINLFIGKDRSPSCGVRTAKIYDREKRLIGKGTGLMAQVALDFGIECWDAEAYLETLEGQ